MNRFTLACAAVLTTLAASPSLAQDYRYPPPPPPSAYPVYPAPVYQGPYAPAPDYRGEDDIVIYGHYGPRPEDADSASTRVSYADLDLYYPEDRRELRRRISLTARYLCDRLGESDSYTYGSSCRDEATRDALRRVGTIEAHWAPRGTAWVR